jgi:hypothetical protein
MEQFSDDDIDADIDKLWMNTIQLNEKIIFTWSDILFGSTTDP